MAAIVDSRPSFQGVSTSSDWNTRTKEVYIKNRFRDGVYWFGYFVDAELIGFHEAHVCGFSEFDFVDGPTYTMKGKADERWLDTKRSKVAMELLNYAIDFFEATKKLRTYWVVGSKEPTGAGRFVEAPGCRLLDGTWDRIDAGVVEANTFSGNFFIDSWVLMDGMPIKDQLIMRFDKQGWVDPSLPPGSPPMQRTSSFNGIHPPRGTEPNTAERPPE